MRKRRTKTIKQQQAASLRREFFARGGTPRQWSGGSKHHADKRPKERRLARGRVNHQQED